MQGYPYFRYRTAARRFRMHPFPRQLPSTPAMPAKVFDLHHRASAAPDTDTHEPTLTLEELAREQAAWRRPTAAPSRGNWLQRLVQQVHGGEPDPAWEPSQPGSAWLFGRGSRLARARAAFEQVLADIDTPQAELLVLRIRRAETLPELWHLRSRLFDVISRALSEEEAHRRLSDLDCHFPNSASRTGFGTL